jgi:anti-sigma regulatory factor (Ser/Thr protein kinase)
MPPQIPGAADLLAAPSQQVGEPVSSRTVLVGHEVRIERDPASAPGAITAQEAEWPRRLRRIVRALLRYWGWPDLMDVEELLTTELVTNALRYGSGKDICYRLYATRSHLITEVRDGSPDAPVLGHASPTAESGRGLFLVDAMAADWGVSPDGTTTWCSLPLRKGPTPMQPVAPPVPVLRQYPSISLPGDSRAVTRVRTIARAGLTVIGWKGAVNAATDVLAQLVDNAVEHAVTDARCQKLTVDLKINEVNQLLIDVHDPEPHFPDFEKALAGEQGRGLWEVQRLGAVVTWFVAPDGHGKIVRATLTPGPVEP